MNVPNCTAASLQSYLTNLNEPLVKGQDMANTQESASMNDAPAEIHFSSCSLIDRKSTQLQLRPFSAEVPASCGEGARSAELLQNLSELVDHFARLSDGHHIRPVESAEQSGWTFDQLTQAILSINGLGRVIPGQSTKRVSPLHPGRQSP